MSDYPLPEISGGVQIDELFFFILFELVLFILKDLISQTMLCSTVVISGVRSGFARGFHATVASGGHGWSSVEAALVLVKKLVVSLYCFFCLLEFMSTVVASFNIIPKVAALLDIVA